MKKQARLQSENVFKNPADKVLDTLETLNSTEVQQDINTGIQHDTLRKLSFQIRDSVYRQLIKSHNAHVEKLGDDAPDREVIVENAIVRYLEKAEELEAEIAHRQRIRRQELESGALVNPSSRKQKK